MMKNVQKQKVVETMVMLFRFYHDKEEFMKTHIPVQEYLITKIQETVELSFKVMNKIGQILKEEKNQAAAEYELKEKALLSKREDYKLASKKNPSETFTAHDWNRNMLRTLQAWSQSHAVRTNELKKRYKCVQNCYNEIIKQEQRYKSEVKTVLKQIKGFFQQIDDNEKQQNKIVAKMARQSKNKEMKSSIYFLSELKKTQSYLMKEIQAFATRGNTILNLVKVIVKNERQTSRKVKEILVTMSTKNKEILKSTPSSDHFDGVLTVLEDGIQEARELYLEKTLISQQIQEIMVKLVPAEKSKLHHVMKYLGLESKDIENKIGAKTRLEILACNLSFKNWKGISLAQGWIMTSFTPSLAYLTFDHYLALYDISGTLLKKISSSSSKINKVGDNNIVYLEETIKGFFTDSKQEYQLKFEDSDKMEEFILFIENQIN